MHGMAPGTSGLAGGRLRRLSQRPALTKHLFHPLIPARVVPIEAVCVDPVTNLHAVPRPFSDLRPGHTLPALAGVSPLEASSGKITRHRLNPSAAVSSSGWQSIPVPVVPGFLPGYPGGDPPSGARVQVALLEVNAPVAA